MGVRIQNLHLHLHRRFGAIGLRGNLCNGSIPLQIRIGIHHHYAFLPGPEFGEVILRNIKFDLQVVKIGQRDNESLRSALSRAGESRGHQFALFCRSFENRSCDGSANYRRIQQRLRVISLPLRLLQRALARAISSARGPIFAIS